MREYISESKAVEVCNNGVFLGKDEPCEETKFTWWQVYHYNNDIVACVFSSNGVQCGEKIDASDLHLYCDDVESAIKRLSEQQN